LAFIQLIEFGTPARTTETFLGSCFPTYGLLPSKFGTIFGQVSFGCGLGSEKEQPGSNRKGQQNRKGKRKNGRDWSGSRGKGGRGVTTII
jgi:hypothetical protein